MEWYTIGLQCGKNVAEMVDELIKSEPEDLKTKRREKLVDDSVLYEWYMKWNPRLFNCEKKLINILHEFDDGLEYATDEEYYGNAYKLLAVGDEGGEDEYMNDAGEDIYDDLYIPHEIHFPRW